MKSFDGELAGVKIFKLDRFEDIRGYFQELYSIGKYCKDQVLYDWKQTNISRSHRYVLRGLHFQKRIPQAKLVTCISGAIFDVTVDLRPDSETFGKWMGVRLSKKNNLQIFIPKGFAHGFYTLTREALVHYQADAVFDPQDDSGLFWNDPNIGIKWPINYHTPIVSEKDSKLSLLKDLKFSV